MSATSANLASLLQTKADITYYTQQMMFWTNKYDANAAKLQQQVKYETKWESAFDKAIDNKRPVSHTAPKLSVVTNNPKDVNMAIWHNHVMVCWNLDI